MLVSEVVHGRQIADTWLKMTPEQQAQVSRMQTKLGRIIELGEQDPARLEQAVERLRADSLTARSIKQRPTNTAR